MHYSNKIRLICLILGLFFLSQLLACKGEEKVSKPAAETEVAETEVVEMKDIDPAGLCPQTRGTTPAPELYAGMTNILPASAENIAAGKQLFHQDTKPITCETCHGFKGNGLGVIFARMQPYPRDFTCYQTMQEVSDGQMYWIIRHGSHGTRMKPYKQLKEDETWQLVHYLRHFAD